MIAVPKTVTSNKTEARITTGSSHTLSSVSVLGAVHMSPTGGQYDTASELRA